MIVQNTQNTQCIIAKSECLTLKELFLKQNDFVSCFQKRLGKSFFNHTLSCSINYYSWAS